MPVVAVFQKDFKIKYIIMLEMSMSISVGNRGIIWANLSKGE